MSTDRASTSSLVTRVIHAIKRTFCQKRNLSVYYVFCRVKKRKETKQNKKQQKPYSIHTSRKCVTSIIIS